MLIVLLIERASAIMLIEHVLVLLLCYCWSEFAALASCCSSGSRALHHSLRPPARPNLTTAPFVQPSRIFTTGIIQRFFAHPPMMVNRVVHINNVWHHLWIERNCSAKRNCYVMQIVQTTTYFVKKGNKGDKEIFVSLSRAGWLPIVCKRFCSTSHLYCASISFFLGPIHLYTPWLGK